MSEWIRIEDNGLHLAIEITEDKDARLVWLSARPLDPAYRPGASERQGCRLVEVQEACQDQTGLHGERHIGTSPGRFLAYTGHRDRLTALGRRLSFDLAAPGIEATVHLQFIHGVQAIRTWTDVRATGSEDRVLEYVSSFCLTGLLAGGGAPLGERVRLHVPHNTWVGEAQWTSHRPDELGLVPGIPGPKRISYAATGSWPSDNWLPLGAAENLVTGEAAAWQIEACGSWQWELGLNGEDLVLQLSGPTAQENVWWKVLHPGEAFSSVPVAVAFSTDGLDGAFGGLTSCRRAMRHPHWDNMELPVIFNDYMNCLMGDPTTEKLLPLIDAAAEAGCEVFCIDAGWYSDGWWWMEVGEWLPSKKRFPGGLSEPLGRIRQRGMIPGLWIEIEVMGVNCPLAAALPDEWFFTKHGRRIVDHGRYQLDFRHPGVRAHADRILDRLVNEYGAGYIKVDYNINIRSGTDRHADSPGDGLLTHNRAYMGWLEGLMQRHPRLIVENCGSGGMRMTYGFLGVCSIQSSSDQTDYRKYAAIAAAAATAVTPEQCAVWSYPMQNGDREETVMNMVNALLMRIHQSGHLAQLAPERFALVREGIALYKRIRPDIREALPVWPLGLRRMGADCLAYGLQTPGRLYLAVWRMHEADGWLDIPLAGWRGREAEGSLLYPAEGPGECVWKAGDGILSVRLPQAVSARLFLLESTGSSNQPRPSV